MYTKQYMSTMPYKAYIVKQIPCCELLTWSVTGMEPDQVLLCQPAAELIRIQSAGHQRATTIDYRSMRLDSPESAMLTAEEGIFRY